MAMAFAVVGLVGLFAAFAAPLPLQRAFVRDQALDEVLTLAPDAEPSPALRIRLDDSAAAVAPGAPDRPGRVARERRAMHERMQAEAAAVGVRLRIEILVVTLMGAAFGVATMRFAMKGQQQSPT